MKVCHACKTAWEGAPGSQPGRGETCGKCGMDLHVCLNCRLYDPGAANECRSSTTERVRDKDKRNFCDEFQFADKGPGGVETSPPSDSKKKWDDLFK
ncbi:MAG: hypothetical protein ACREL1_00150 [bacterium]